MGRNMKEIRQGIWILLCSVLAVLYGCGSGGTLSEDVQSDMDLCSMESDIQEDSYDTCHSTESYYNTEPCHSTEAYHSTETDHGTEPYHSTESYYSTEPYEEMAVQENLYAAVIEAARESVMSGEHCDRYALSSVLHQRWAYERLGYLIEDIDGDGTCELVIGENETKPDSGWDGIVYDLFTITDGELVHVFDGWERNRYYLCDNGMIANEGSSGAGDSVTAYYTFDGKSIQLVEAVIYAAYRNADQPWFYSTLSEHDTEQAEPISEEQADAIKGKYQYRHPQFIPFVDDNMEENSFQ